MTTTETFTFAPSSSAPYQFQPTFDGTIYTAIVTWSLFGRRYYINCYDLSGNLQFALPMIGSPDNYDISISGGYFATKLVFRTSANQFEIID